MGARELGSVRPTPALRGAERAPWRAREPTPEHRDAVVVPLKRVVGHHSHLGTLFLYSLNVEPNTAANALSSGII